MNFTEPMYNTTVSPYEDDEVSAASITRALISFVAFYFFF